MPITKRQYEKDQAVLNIQTSVSVTPSITATPSITPTISVTPSITPTVTPSITITPSISITPSPTPSSAYFYLSNIYNCYSGSGLIECGQFIGQTSIYNPSSNFTVGNFYTGSNNLIYQPVSVTTSGSGAITVNGGAGYTSCTLACSSSYS